MSAKGEFVGVEGSASVRVRLAAVAAGRTATAPPIPQIGIWGISDPPMPVATPMRGRASHVLPPRTSARRPRNVASPTAPTDVRFEPHASCRNCGVAQGGIAALLVALILPTSVVAGPSPTSNSIGQEFQIEHKSQKAGELIEHGIALRKAGKLKEAEQIFLKLIREYPNATYEDEIGAGRYSDDARDHLAVIICLKKRGPDVV